MNELQNTYIRNQLLTMPLKTNQELSYKGEKFNKRSDYTNIIKYIDKFLDGEIINRFLVLPGIRDVGKTTLLFQVYEYLMKEKGISPKNILYFSCDRLKKFGKIDIYELISSYIETYHNSIIETLDEPIFLLIDEAQYDKDWSLNGKLLFDGSQKIFMIFSGSSALKLSYSPDSARRLLNMPIYPLTYREHLNLKYGTINRNGQESGTKAKTSNDFISQSLEHLIFDGETENIGEIERKIFEICSSFPNYNPSEWKNFLEFGGFPSSFHQDANEINKKIVNMVDKVVRCDMNTINGINEETQYLAFQILNFLAFQNPGEVSIGSLSNRFDENKGRVSKVLDILEKTQLIFHIEAFTSSVKRTTKPHEYFFATSSLKHNLALDLGNAFLEDETAYYGKLLENFTAASFKNLDNASRISYKTYYDDSRKKSDDRNVDFIVQRGMDKPIPIEVNCGKKDKSQIGRAIRRYKSPHGIIISNNHSSIVKEDNIIYLPPEIFAFM